MDAAFVVHFLNAKGRAVASEIAAHFDDLASKLKEIVPGGRELSIVMTKLEEACYFAKKGIAKIDKHQADPADAIVPAPAAAAAPTEVVSAPPALEPQPLPPSTKPTAVVDTKAIMTADTEAGPADPTPPAENFAAARKAHRERERAKSMA